MSVTVLISYVGGTQRLMKACLSSILKYRAGVHYKLHVVTEERWLSEAEEIRSDVVSSVIPCQVDGNAPGSYRHSAMLDKYMESAEGMVLTLDSDRFPVADGWLGELYSMQGEGRILPGIRWPWKPPCGSVSGLEERVRTNLNWNNTWVACQLVDPNWVRVNGLKYRNGDDTGFELTAKAREQWLSMPGWKPSRCALPEGDIDPELNRMFCVAYGDKVVHIGGGSGKAVGREIFGEGCYGKAVERILEEGAEWMLDDSQSHRYVFDREDEVVEYKMGLMYNEMKAYLETHDSLF